MTDEATPRGACCDAGLGPLVERLLKYSDIRRNDPRESRETLRSLILGELRDALEAERAAERERCADALRCAQIVREAWEVHGLCCRDAPALADLLLGLGKRPP